MDFLAAAFLPFAGTPARAAMTAAVAVGGLVSAGALMVARRLNLFYIWSHNVDKNTKRNGGDLVADVLKAHGVETIFTLSGGHISPILVGAEKKGIQIIDTRHEVNAVFAADAVARLTGRVGVACVTAGPGLTNTITAVKNAQMAESPLLLLGGAAATLLKGRGALQDIDQVSLFQSLCKHIVTVTAVRDIVPELRKAIQIARSGTPGPVFVELPLDVLYPYYLVQKEIGGATPGKTVQQKLVNWYLDKYLANIYAGAFENRDLSPLPVNIPMPSTSDVSTCATFLTQSRRPVLVLGSQVMLPPTKPEELQQAIKDLGVPCFLGGMSRGLLGRNSSIQFRHCRRDALKDADLILLVGSVADFRLGYGRSLGRKAKIVAVNRSKEQLYKNSDMFWKPALAAQCDAGAFMIQLAAATVGHRVDPEWLATLRQKDDRKEETNKKMADSPVDQFTNPIKLLFELDKKMADDAIIVADGGDFVGTAAYVLRPRGPLCWLDPGAFGTLGVGGGFALGAKAVFPEREVWIVYGDGSCGYSIAEVDTFTRFNLPVLEVIGNDACWTQIAREQLPMLGSEVACKLIHTDYHTVAEGYGAKGILLKEEDKIEAALDEALMAFQEGKSAVVNALIGKTSFREGSISV